MRKISEKEGKETYGKKVDGELSLVDSEKIFTWDHRTLDKADSDSHSGKFLTDLDQMLAPHGLEVVKIGFDGDMFPWCIEKKL